ncbi:MAG: hypothetical protein H0S80_07865 [Desulfovibrionaceae bacterium]|nr:hypothetical protein [Desulfovibrionaceae bacterium]
MRRIHMKNIFSPAVRTGLVLVCAMLLSWGCMPKQVVVKSADMLSTPNLLAEADAAWEAKRWEVVELYYAEALERADLVRSELPPAYARLARSAFLNGHPQQARIALESWANIDSNALNSVDWEETYLDTMAALDKTERLQNHLRWVLESAIPWDAKQAVALWFGRYFLDKADFERSLDVLDAFYKQAPAVTPVRSAFEHELLQWLDRLDDEQVAGLGRAVTPVNQWHFPYALVAFEQGVRAADDPDEWPTIWRTMRNLAANAELADMVPLTNKLAELEARYGLPSVGLALALPITGPYAKVGVKILRGAGLAQWRLAQDGVDVDLKVINTEIPGWETRLAALPGHYSVIGGPLRVDAFKQLYEAGGPGRNVLRQRAVFTFLASLGDLTEGRDAWRFFTSRVDEVRSLVDLAVNELHITDLAVLYPEEKFGRTMAQIFYSQAAPLGGRIRGMQSYPPGEFKQWSKRIGKLLKVPDDFHENTEAPLEQPDFGAVFIPDGWRQAQTLLPNFFFYEGDSLVFLGPGLWSRALDSAKGVDEHYYRLAVCPGAWWKDSDGGRRLQSALTEEGLGQADFWVALGYDFIRFAGKFGTLPSGWTPSDVNRRIRSAQDMDFSMAPLTWDDSGVGSQNLFLFSPVRNGKELVNAEKITERIARAASRRERRIEAYEERMKEQEAKTLHEQDGPARNPDIPPGM